MCLQVKEQRPAAENQPVVPSRNLESNFDTVLGFAGGCMRLIYKKSCSDTRRVIELLQMTPKMKRFYTKCKILAPGTAKYHCSIPVRGMNEYLKLVTELIKNNVTEQALLLYRTDFIKVCNLLRVIFIKKWILIRVTL